MLELYQALSFALPKPEGDWPELDAWSKRLSDVLVDTHLQIENDMALSLKSLYRADTVA